MFEDLFFCINKIKKSKHVSNIIKKDELLFLFQSFLVLNCLKVMFSFVLLVFFLLVINTSNTQILKKGDFYFNKIYHFYCSFQESFNTTLFSCISNQNQNHIAILFPHYVRQNNKLYVQLKQVRYVREKMNELKNCYFQINK